MIAHISLAGISFEESGMTLIYAYRTKNIQTQVNERTTHTEEGLEIQSF